MKIIKSVYSQNLYATLLALKPAAKCVVDQKAVDKLLRLVAESEQDQAEEMIKKDGSLLLTAGTVTDLSGRKFKQITAFQTVLWALDWHMWEMIRQYLLVDVQMEQFKISTVGRTGHFIHALNL